MKTEIKIIIESACINCKYVDFDDHSIYCKKSSEVVDESGYCHLFEFDSGDLKLVLSNIKSIEIKNSGDK